MANPICLSPLKFYDQAAKQNHRKSYAFGQFNPLWVKLNMLPPFQFVVPSSATNISYVYLYEASTDKKEVNTNLAQSFKEAGLQIITVGNYKVVKYNGYFGIPEIKNNGLYYLYIQLNTGDKFYSEVFCSTKDTSNFIEIEYWNPGADFELKNGIVTFEDNFRFKLLLKAELCRPEYEFEEESTSRMGYDFIESQVSKKIYKFTALVPEYLCDAMRIIRLCSNKILTSLDETYDMLSFNMDVEWQDQGDIAAAECEFEVDNVIVGINSTTSSQVQGSFNNDFNNDFKND